MHKEPVSQDEEIIQHTAKLQKTNYFLTIILVCILSVGATLGIIYKDGLIKIINTSASQKQTAVIPQEESLTDKTSTASAVTSVELEAYKKRSVYYYNCKHGYEFYYPREWTNNGMTFDSDIVELYGNGSTTSIQTYPNTQYLVLNDDSLYAFAASKNKALTGLETGTRDKQRNGIHILAYAYTNPQALAIYWQEKNYQIEMKFIGNWGNEEEKNVQYLISTYKPGAYNIPECQNQPTASVPAFALPDSNQGDAGVPESCSFPNGDVEFWWDSASQESKNCFLNQGGVAPR